VDDAVSMSKLCWIIRATQPQDINTMPGYEDCRLSLGNQLYSLYELLHGFSVGLVIHGSISLSLETCKYIGLEVKLNQNNVSQQMKLHFCLNFCFHFTLRKVREGTLTYILFAKVWKPIYLVWERFLNVVVSYVIANRASNWCVKHLRLSIYCIDI
jgi:hypothetical protein